MSITVFNWNLERPQSNLTKGQSSWILLHIFTLHLRIGLFRTEMLSTPHPTEENRLGINENPPQAQQTFIFSRLWEDILRQITHSMKLVDKTGIYFFTFLYLPFLFFYHASHEAHLLLIKSLLDMGIPNSSWFCPILFFRS